MNDKLLEYLVERICLLSPLYRASIPELPRKYCKVCLLLEQSRLAVKYKRGMLLERRRRALFHQRLPKKAFVFEPELEKKVRRIARSDEAFSLRLSSLTLSPDDIESIVSELTFGQIRLHLHGRKVFEEDSDDI